MLSRLGLFICLQFADITFAAGQSRPSQAIKNNGLQAYYLVCVLVFIGVILSTLRRDLQRMRQKQLTFKGLIADLLWTCVPFAILALLSLAVA